MRARLLALYVLTSNSILRRRGRVAALAKKRVYVETHEFGGETCQELVSEKKGESDRIDNGWGTEQDSQLDGRWR